jgi:proline dehydrogenase
VVAAAKDADVAPAPKLSLWERMIVGVLPVVPRWGVKRVAQRYVAGESLSQAMSTVEALNAEGSLATVDLLGESVTTEAQARSAVEEYLRLLEAIATGGLQSGVSVKLTALGLKLDEALSAQNLNQIARRAREHGLFVRIDMEDHTCTDATLRVYRQLQPQVGNLGVVLQAMLRRTPDDIAALLAAGSGLNVRLCKGIYREPPELAFQDADEVRQAYVACLDQLLGEGAHVGIATHDDALVEAGLQRVSDLSLSPEAYEFQMLLGVRPQLRQRLLDEKHRLRVYVPYGADWYAYSLRRLRENPAIAGHVTRAMLKRG